MDEGSAFGERPSAEAQNIMDTYFPSEDGLVALLVYHDEVRISDGQREEIADMSEWLNSDEKPDNISSALPFHKLPDDVQDDVSSADESTVHIDVAVKTARES